MEEFVDLPTWKIDHHKNDKFREKFEVCEQKWFKTNEYKTY